MGVLAINCGKRAVTLEPGDIFRWSRVTDEMERAVLEVLRTGNMSGTDLTKRFEEGYAAWSGTKYALAHSSGTASLQAAMYGVGLKKGDELICPAVTYWASCAQALSLGASVVFADIDPVTLCISPADFERKISPRTKAVVVVHHLGVPADMDPIMEIARKHKIKVIEDVSHAQGARYKGRVTGSFGDVSGISLMSGKSFAIGEGGILTTNDRLIYERALFWGHYERHNELTYPELTAAAGLPAGGYKYRMHQMSSAVGLEQLKKYDAEVAEIEDAMQYFWSLLKDVPAVKPHIPPYPNSTKGGWYAPHGFYDRTALGDLSVTAFAEAVRAEGVPDVIPGCYAPLPAHPLFNTLDVYGDGKPTNLANLPDGISHSNGPDALPVAYGIQEKIFHHPTFKVFHKKYIGQAADAFKKVIDNYQELLAEDKHEKSKGKWALTARKG